MHMRRCGLWIIHANCASVSWNRTWYRFSALFCWFTVLCVSQYLSRHRESSSLVANGIQHARHPTPEKHSAETSRTNTNTYGGHAPGKSGSWNTSGRKEVDSVYIWLYCFFGWIGIKKAERRWLSGSEFSFLPLIFNHHHQQCLRLHFVRPR